MKFIYDDGGRANAGYKGRAGDCVCRAVSISSGKPYAEIYAALATSAGNERKSRGASARNGIHTNRKWFKDYMVCLGFAWTPTMGIGTGCKVHLTDGELPMGTLLVSVSRHVTAVIDGVIHDTYDPQREVHICEPDHGQPLEPGEWRNANGIWHASKRCVYGYWRK